MKSVTGRLVSMAMVVVGGMILSADSMQAQGREEFRFGFFGGININMVGTGASNMSTIDSNDVLFPLSSDLSDGQGIAPYFGIITEYTTDGVLGLALRLSADQRNAEMEDAQSDGSEARVFTARVSYLTIEPGMRFAIGSPNFSFTVGPALAVLLSAKYDYDVNGDDTQVEIGGRRIEHMNNVAFGFWGDLGYDIALRGGEEGERTSIYLTPFLGASWLLDQRKASFATQEERDDAWTTISIRTGLQLKFGSGD